MKISFTYVLCLSHFLSFIFPEHMFGVPSRCLATRQLAFHLSQPCHRLHGTGGHTTTFLSHHHHHHHHHLFYTFYYQILLRLKNTNMQSAATITTIYIGATFDLQCIFINSKLLAYMGGGLQEEGEAVVDAARENGGLRRGRASGEWGEEGHSLEAEHRNTALRCLPGLAPLCRELHYIAIPYHAHCAVLKKKKEHVAQVHVLGYNCYTCTDTFAPFAQVGIFALVGILVSGILLSLRVSGCLA